MFAYKKKYFLIIESIKDIEIKNLKKCYKFLIIYRNLVSKENLAEIIRFRKLCKLKSIEFYVANNIKLATYLKSDGIYLSSFIRNFKALHLKNLNYKIIGSAHNVNEINLKKKQGCDYILFSKLFMVDYQKKAPHLGLIKFNKFVNSISKKLIPLGGIKISNLNYMKNIKSEGFALLSEVKKKPANIISRLF
jgi:thiamine monophosphate synthase